MVAVSIMRSRRVPKRVTIVVTVAVLGIPVAVSRAASLEQADAVVDDRDITRRFTWGLEKLLEDGRSSPQAKLIKQLERKRCRLRLPKLVTSRRMSPPEIYRRRRSGVLIVGALYKCSKCPKWHASVAAGIALTPGGVIATNYHVVKADDRKGMGAMTAEGKVYPVREVLAADAANDVAILKLDGARLAPLPLAVDEPVGSPVTVISHPAKQFYTLTTGVICRYVVHRYGGKDVRRLAISADFARGSSGAPVFNDRGAVVGMVISTRSIYARKEDGEHQNLQMVSKYGAPAGAIQELMTLGASR